MRDLVYYVVGGHPEYVELLKFSINTVRHFPENHKIDIMVMCDADYAPYVSACSIDNIHIHITPNNSDHVIASMRKTEIFDFLEFHQYDRVLFLDCDIVIAGPLQPIFDLLQRDDVLYVVHEGTENSLHTNLHWHCRDKPYDPATLAAFEEKGIYVFNAGQFGFRPSMQMKEHFAQICKEKQCYNSSFHFYEQSFMNNHFNRSFAVAYDMKPYVRLFAQSNPEGHIINHFSGCGTSFQTKLEQMRAFHHVLHYIDRVA